MQYRFVRIALLLLTLMGSVPLSAQYSFHISWDSLNVPNPSVVNVNDTFRYDLTINNLTNSAFNDSLYFNLRTNLGGPFRIAAFDSVAISALGSQAFSIPDTASALRYGSCLFAVASNRRFPRSEPARGIFQIARQQGCHPKIRDHQSLWIGNSQLRWIAPEYVGGRLGSGHLFHPNRGWTRPHCPSEDGQTIASTFFSGSYNPIRILP